MLRLYTDTVTWQVRLHMHQAIELGQTSNKGAWINKDQITPCIKRSVVYENIFAVRNKGVGGKGEFSQEDPNTPSIYVGETSRSQLPHHEGALPDFKFRAVKFHKSALDRR